MSTRALLRFVVAGAASALALHVVVSLAAAAALERLYPHRIFNVRAWSDDARERSAIVGSFLLERARRDGRPLVAFIGSSVAYGYPWDERFIASQSFAEHHRQLTVVNASVLGVDADGLAELVLCSAERNGIRFDVAVIEIPVVNTTSHMSGIYRAGKAWRQVGSCGDPRQAAGYARLALTHPRGMGWLRLLWNRDSNQTEDSLSIGSVATGYFVSTTDFSAIRSNYLKSVTTLLRRARRVADRVYAFPSPVFVGGLAEAGEDARAIQHQLETTVEACASVPGVDCLDTSALWTNRSDYYNFTHLSKAGHRTLAEMVSGAMAGQQRTASH